MTSGAVVVPVRRPPPLRRDVRALLDPRHNPFFAHGEAQCFLVLRDGWVLEDNLPMRNALERMGFERYKTYRVYERLL